MEHFDLSDSDGTSYLHLLRNRSTLWELNNQPQYYEVEIKQDHDRSFTKNMDEIINMNRLHCSICDLDIPKIYFKQHKESFIHQNFIKLTNKVLERTIKHLLTNDGSVNTSVHLTDTFFCNTCSKIVENKNMDEHSESKLHKKHIVFEKLLKTFVETYFGADENVQCDSEDLKEFMNDKNETDPIKTSDPPENSLNNLSEIKSTVEPAYSKVPPEYTVNIFDPNYLKELLDSATNEPEPENSTTVEKGDLLKSSKMNPMIGHNVPKDTKSGHSNNQSNSNTMDPIFQQNYRQINPNSNQINPISIDPNYHARPINPYFNPTRPNAPPMNPHFNFNQMNPNFHNMYPNLNPYINNMNPNFNPNFNNINPNFNPMNPNINTTTPNFHTTTPNFHPLHTNFNPMNYNFNPMNSNPMNTNFIPINPNFNAMNPNFNPITPNFNQIHPTLNPMDSQLQTNSNINHMKHDLRPLHPNLHPSDPRYRLGPNLNPTGLQNNGILNATDPRNKSDGNFNTTVSQPQLGPNLSVIDPKTELEGNLLDPKPNLSPSLEAMNAETKISKRTVNKAEKSREKQLQQLKAFEEFSFYIKTIREKYPNPGFNIEAVTVGKIKVTALNGDCVLVTKENFQSYQKKFCRVCQNVNLDKNHEMLEEHIFRIMVPVADKNCIREVDDIWSHCIICNELIREVEIHIKTVSHIANLEESFIDTSKKTQDPTAINAKLLAIDDTISNGAVNTNEVPSKKESRKVEEKDTIVISQKEKVHFDIDSFSNTLTNKLLPLFAKYAFNKSDTSEPNKNNQEETMESENSVEISNIKDYNQNKVKKLKKSIQSVVDISISEPKMLGDEIDSNSSNPTKNIAKYCTVCRIHVSNFETHKTSESHAEISNQTRELRKLINRNNLKGIKDNLNLLKCEICDVNVKYETTRIEEHVNSQNHKRNYFKFIELNKIILIDQSESQCEPCNKHMERSNIFDHCKQDKHVKKLKDYISIASSQTKLSLTHKETKSKQCTENKAIVHKDIDVTKILYHFRAQGVEYLCKTCHVLIARNASSVKEHVESKHHLDKYSTIIRSNRIIRTSGSFYCEACDEKIPTSGEIVHIYSSSHSEKLYMKAKDKVVKDKSNETTLSKSTVVSCSIAPIASTSADDISSSKTELTIPLYVKFQYKEGSDNNTICLICEEDVRKLDMTSHANLARHYYNFNLIMIKNAIKIKDNMYFCVFCETGVPIFGELQHIFGRSHLNKIVNKKDLPVASNGRGMLTYDHVLSLTQGKRMVKF